MRKELIDWIGTCKTEMETKLRSNEESIMTLHALVTQYELAAVHLLKLGKTQKHIKELKKALVHYKEKWHHKNLSNKLSLSCSTSVSKTDILFWPFQKMHVENVKSIYPKALEQGLQVKVFSQNPSIIQNIQELEGFISTNNFHPKPIDFLKIKSNKLLLKAAKKCPVFSNNGQEVSFYEVLKMALENGFNWIYYTIKYFNIIVEKYRPKIIFVGNDLTYVGSTVSYLSKKKEIPTFTLMHGTIKSELWKYSNADYFFLFGEKDRYTMLQRNIQSSKLIVSGSPKLEQNLIAFKKYRQNHKSSKVILVALSGPGHSITEEHHQKTIALLANIIPHYSEWNFVFKLHKKDKLFYYKTIKELDNVQIITSNEKKHSSEIFYWLAQTKVLITGASSTAIEAMTVDIPVITIDLLNHLKDVDFIRLGYTLHVENLTQFKEKLNWVIQEKDEVQVHLSNIKKFIKTAFHQPAMGSATFIINTIQSFLKSPKKETKGGIHN